MMVVPVLTMSCQVSEKPNSGPVGFGLDARRGRRPLSWTMPERLANRPQIKRIGEQREPQDGPFSVGEAGTISPRIRLGIFPPASDVSGRCHPRRGQD